MTNVKIGEQYGREYCNETNDRISHIWSTFDSLFMCHTMTLFIHWLEISNITP